MRFGFCTGFATPMKDGIDFKLLEDVRNAGYDYAEFPLAQLSSLEPARFGELEGWMRRSGLSCDACCNMFPGSLRLTGPRADFTAAREYLLRAFPLMARLGSRIIVLGSSGARNLPEGVKEEEGYRQLAGFLGEHVVPLLEEYGMTLVMEPIGSYEANFINTLPDGMEVVRRVDHPRVRLLADSVHVLYEDEDPDDLRRFAPYLMHIHVCEALRALPLPGPSDGLRAFLDAVRDIGYDGGVSFESVPYPASDMARALAVLREALGR